jgi:hypothetical protein
MRRTRHLLITSAAAIAALALAAGPAAAGLGADREGMTMHDNPGMARMHELHQSEVPGMARMHEAHMRAQPPGHRAMMGH